ncbi:MAG TPA: hypothetical protein PKV71_19950, partial [Calditrichia bacterium]|nr:hypothetical protein [Calditrichia bacterium]
MNTVPDAENRQLRRQIETLENRLSDFQQLGRVLETIGSALQVNEVVEKIVEETIDLCHADQGAVVL